MRSATEPRRRPGHPESQLLSFLGGTARTRAGGDLLRDRDREPLAEPAGPLLPTAQPADRAHPCGPPRLWPADFFPAGPQKWCLSAPTPTWGFGVRPPHAPGGPGPGPRGPSLRRGHGDVVHGFGATALRFCLCALVPRKWRPTEVFYLREPAKNSSFSRCGPAALLSCWGGGRAHSHLGGSRRGHVFSLAGAHGPFPRPLTAQACRWRPLRASFWDGLRMNFLPGFRINSLGSTAHGAGFADPSPGNRGSLGRAPSTAAGEACDVPPSPEVTGRAYIASPESRTSRPPRRARPPRCASRAGDGGLGRQVRPPGSDRPPV